MRIFVSTFFTETFAAQSLFAQDCPTLCNYDFWRSANVEAVKTAIDNGEDVNAIDEFGFPVFSMIMGMNTTEFLQYNPDGDAVGEQARLDSLVLFLIDEGVNLATNDQTRTPYLHIAAQNGSPAVVRRLIDSGASVTELGPDEETTLHAAAAGGNIETMELLIAAGININAVNEDDETPLFAAADASFQSPKAADTMIWLIEHGADVNAQESRFQQTPIMKLLFRANAIRVDDFPRVLAAAENAGYDISLTNNDGKNILHYAAWTGKDQNVVQYLLDQGADISVLTSQGETAYDLAIQNPALRDTDIIAALQP